ncbi:MAG: DUF3267 domain-containing protein [Sedimentisphaerales bacterium]
MIPGFIITILTFPGVIVHEFAHMLFCKIRGVAVLDVCFFRLGNPSGYVVHEETKDFTTTFLVAVGPFIVNSLLCMVICFPALFPVRIFGVEDILSYTLLWLGVSIGMHSFPSTGDASSLFQQAKKAASSLNPLAIISFPLVIVIYAANILRFFWFDYIYGVAIGLGLPLFLLEHVL